MAPDETTLPTRGARHRALRDRRRGELHRGLALLVGLLALLTVAGGVALWPRDRPAAQPLLATGATLQHADVVALRESACPGGGGSDASSGSSTTTSGTPAALCGKADVRLRDGPDAGRTVTVDVPPEAVSAGLGSGVLLVRSPGQAGQAASYSLQDVERGTPLLWLTVLFVAVVLLVARWRGLRALVGLVVAGAVVGLFVLPAILAGRSAVAVGLVGASAIVLVVLYLAHGVSVRTTVALLGTYGGLALTGVVGALAVRAAHLTGVSSDESSLLESVAGRLQPRDLLTCAVLLAGLGVLNDVTIAQTSAVWELAEAAPDLGRRGLWVRGMRIGRDHIASTIYTIVFAYAGAALPVLLLLTVYDQPLATSVTGNDIAEEVVRTLASGVGLVLAVPLTTALAAATVRALHPVRARLTA